MAQEGGYANSAAYLVSPAAVYRLPNPSSSESNMLNGNRDKPTASLLQTPVAQMFHRLKNTPQPSTKTLCADSSNQTNDNEKSMQENVEPIQTPFARIFNQLKNSTVKKALRDTESGISSQSDSENSSFVKQQRTDKSSTISTNQTGIPESRVLQTQQSNVDHAEDDGTTSNTAENNELLDSAEPTIDMDQVDEKKMSAPEKQSSPPLTRRQFNEKSGKTTIRLRNWIIKPVGGKKSGNICIQGDRLVEDELVGWHTSSITKRVLPSTVATASGSQYQLLGKMNVKQAEEMTDLPRKLLLQFCYGFPQNWRELLDQVYSMDKSSGSTRKVRGPGKSNKAVHTPKSMSDDTQDSNFNCTLETLPQTRSGRKVVPPLDWWRGERLKVDKTEKSDIALETGSPDYIGAFSVSVMNWRQRACFGSFKRKAKALKSSPVVPDQKSNQVSKNKQSNKVDCGKADSASEENDVQVRKTRSKANAKNAKPSASKKEPTKPVLRRRSSQESMSESDVNSKSVPRKNLRSNKARNTRKTTGRKDVNTASESEKQEPAVSKKKTTRQSKGVKEPENEHEISNDFLISPAHDRTKRRNVQKKARTEFIDEDIDENSSNSEDCDLFNSDKPSGAKKSREGKRRVTQCYDPEPKQKEWTKAEIALFHKACRQFEPSAPMYWNYVAASLRSRTEEECIEFHQTLIPSSSKPKKPSKRTVKEAITSPSQITGGKKTLKRKRQLRELIENHDNGYSDDFFDSTPCREMPVAKIPRLDLNDSFEGFYADAGKFETPANMKGLSCRLPVSESKTPAHSVLSPGLIQADSEVMDRHVHRLKQRPAWKYNTAKQKQPDAQVVIRKDPPSPIEPIASLFSVHENQENEEEEEDFYFSE